MKIPLLDLNAQYLSIEDEINNALKRSCKSQRFILGPDVIAFEKQIAQYTDTQHAIGVASGSDALLLSLMAAGVGSGDEVITTPYTFFATAGAIARLGAKTVFVDIEPYTYNIDPLLIEDKITSKTKAIIPVHLYGQSADMDPIMEIANRHGLVVIEDAAQAIGAEYNGKKVGSIGHYGCFSFFPSKNLGGFGDGGMIVTNDSELADRLRVLRVHGSKPKYFHKVVGCNSRLDALQAVILQVKLKYLDKWTKSRRTNAECYRQLISEYSLSDQVGTPYIKPSNTHIYNQFTISLKKRDGLLAFLKENEIGTEIYYPLPLHMQECFSDLGYKKGDMPVSEKAASTTMSLPVYPELTEDMQIYVVKMIKKYLA